MRHRSGFTLIELSIVLVIIGLVIGGTLAGRELIENAKVKRELSQLDQYANGIILFAEKYQAMPGDLPATKSLQMLGLTKSCPYGTCNGNKMIEAVTDSTPRTTRLFYPSDVLAYDEWASVFLELQASNMLHKLPYPMQTTAGCTFCARFARSILQAEVGIAAFTAGDDGKLAFFHGLSSWTAGYWLYSSNNTGTPALRPFQAMRLDLKADDGLPSTGRITAINDSWPNWVPDAVNGDCVLTGTPNVYNQGDDERLCWLLIRAGRK